MSYDELELDTLGDRKTALFLIMSDTTTHINFVGRYSAIAAFQFALLDKADDLIQRQGAYSCPVFA